MATSDLKEVFWRSRAELAKLFRPVSTPSDVANLLARLATQHDIDGSEILPCVEEALRISGTSEIISHLFFSICRWAIAALEDSVVTALPNRVKIWPRGSGASRVTYTAAQCRGLLANAFLFNVRDTCAELKQPDHVGGLDFFRMLSSSSTLAAHKIACLLSYFQQARSLEGTRDDERTVEFERRSTTLDLDDFKQWALDRGISSHVAEVEIHEMPMEAPDVDAFVNFANPNFGYGQFIPSCTQEEIMQMCCPEFNVGMLHQGYMMDTEVVIATGVRRFCRYTGYGDHFRLAGEWAAVPCVQNILTMDAATSKHLTEEVVLRDIRKAYMCFQGCRLVSTGKWGCGAFGGSPPHKFAQQVTAASLSGCGLRFSTYGASDGCDEVLEVINSMKPVASELLQAVLIASAGARERRNFTACLRDVLGKKKHSQPSAVEGVSELFC